MCSRPPNARSGPHARRGHGRQAPVGSRGRPGSGRPRNERTAHHGHGRTSTGGYPGRVRTWGGGGAGIALVGAAGCREALCVTPFAGTLRWYRQLPGMDHPPMPIPTYTRRARAGDPAHGGARGCQWVLAAGSGGAAVPPGGAVARSGGAVVPSGGAVCSPRGCWRLARAGDPASPTWTSTAPARAGDPATRP